MNVIQPWKIEIAIVNMVDYRPAVPTAPDNAALLEEIHALHCLTHDDDEVPLEITRELSPVVVDFRENFVAPKVIEFMRDCMGFEVTSPARIDTFAKWFKPGQDLGAHLHGGTHITTVYYPADSEAALMIFDPRFNASRGYPQQVRDKHFAPYVFHPRAGDLVIMPSYLMHGVKVVQEEMRLSLVNDFFFHCGGRQDA